MVTRQRELGNALARAGLFVRAYGHACSQAMTRRKMLLRS